MGNRKSYYPRNLTVFRAASFMEPLQSQSRNHPKELLLKAIENNVCRNFGSYLRLIAGTLNRIRTFQRTTQIEW